MNKGEEFDDDEQYGIDIDHAHPRAKNLVPETFFWDCTDELAPFGSDEGDMALAEYRDWRRQNPSTPTIECLKWVIEGVGEMEFADYNASLVDRDKVSAQVDDDEFDDQQYIYTLDISVIATGFAQLVDEGVIDPTNKPLIKLAIERQLLWSELALDARFVSEYRNNLEVLYRVLGQA